MAVINGVNEEVNGITISDYLEKAGYVPSHVVVEKNLEIIDREEWDKVCIEDGDTVEILRFVSGGER